MSHVFQIPDEIYDEIAAYAAQRGQTPDDLFMTLVTEVVTLLKRVEATTAVHKARFDPAHDPLAPFIGAFDSGDDSGWIERHDEYFAGNGGHGERNGNKE